MANEFAHGFFVSISYDGIFLIEVITVSNLALTLTFPPDADLPTCSLTTEGLGWN